MKACFLTDAWKPIWGGGQEHIWQISQVLIKKHGWTIDVLAPNTGPSEVALGGRFKVIRVGPKFTFPNFLGRFIANFANIPYLFKDYDIYISHSYPTAFFLPLAKLRGKKIGITVHGVGVNVRGAGMLNSFGLMRIPPWIMDKFWPFDVRLTAADHDGFTVVGNGVDVAKFDQVKVRRDPKTFRVFWIGRKDDPVKGVKYLEDAVKEINDPKLVLDIAQNVYGEEKIKRFKQADLFVLPSLSEGLPLVLLEAMAARLPVVVTDVGDCRKIVEEAKCGVVVPPGNFQKLTEAITNMMHRQNIFSLGYNGYRAVKKNYTWNNVVDRLLAAL